MTNNTINTTINLADNHSAEFFFDNAGDCVIIFRKGKKTVGIVQDYRQVNMGFAAKHLAKGYSAITLEALAKALCGSKQFADIKAKVMA